MRFFIVLVVCLVFRSSIALAEPTVQAPKPDAVRLAWDKLEAALKSSPNYAMSMSKLRKDELLRQIDPSRTIDISRLKYLIACYSEETGFDDVEEFEAFRTVMRDYIQTWRTMEWNRMTELVQATMDKPRVVKQTDLLADRQQLISSIERVESRLTNDPNRAKWRNVLRLDLLKQLTSADSEFEDAKWIEACESIWAGRAIWPESVIQALQKSVDRYAATARVYQDKDYLDVRRRNLLELTQLMEDFSKTASDESRDQMAPITGWFAQREDAETLVKALNAKFLRTNFILSVSSATLRKEIDRNINEQFQINEIYVGTPVYGNGSMNGNLTSRLQNRDGFGAVDLNLTGQIQARSSGSRSGVQVSTTGNTSITGTKTILFEEFGLRALPATTQARSSVNFDSINTPQGGRYRSEAVGQVYGSRQQAESETEAAASRFARTRLDEAGNLYANRINAEFRKTVLYPLASYKAVPRIVKTGVVDDRLEMTSVQAQSGNWGADTSPPVPSVAADACLQLHQSAFENTVAARLRGQRLSGDDVLQLFSQNLPPPAKQKETTVDAEEPNDQWSVTFAPENAIKVTVANNQLEVILRVTEFEFRENKHAGMDIVFTYGMTPYDGGLKMIRVDAPQVLPNRLVNGERPRFSGPQQVVRKSLVRRLSAAIPPETFLSSVIPDKAFSRLKISSIQTQQGWLSIELQDAKSPSQTIISVPSVR